MEIQEEKRATPPAPQMEQPSMPQVQTPRLQEQTPRLQEQSIQPQQQNLNEQPLIPRENDDQQMEPDRKRYSDSETPLPAAN